MDNLGRAYRHRAIELITICQDFSRWTKKHYQQDAALTEVLKVCDLALLRAVEAREKPAIHSTDAIETAIEKLCEYESEFHPSHRGDNVRKRMERAEKEDTPPRQLIPFRRIMENRQNSKDESRVVGFHLLKSLTDTRPPDVRQELTKDTKLQEIIWNFIRLSDKLEIPITLAQNPHFYSELRTTSWNAKCNGCTRYPIQCYQGSDSIDVLTNIEGRRVFLEFGENCWAFDNSWETNHLIFQDVFGMLECESSVGKTTRGKKVSWRRVEPPPSQPVVLRTPPRLPVGDWTQAVHDALRSSDVTIIRITDSESPREA